MAMEERVGIEASQPASKELRPSKDAFQMEVISELITGGIIGAAAGAALGSIILPGLGTAIGSGVGAAANALLKDYLKKRVVRAATTPGRGQRQPTNP